MTLAALVALALDKGIFADLPAYIQFCKAYLDFIADGGLQAVIVSRNENIYRFLQYKEDGSFNVTRPINSDLFIPAEQAQLISDSFPHALAHARDIPPEDEESRALLRKSIYTIQQSIGATLDALPANQSNFARKLNGDHFETLVHKLLHTMGVSSESGTVLAPIVVEGQAVGNMRFQQDLIVSRQDVVRIIGSVKTSSKDRIGKIFTDKLLYCQLSETNIPHIALFLNDVQRTGRHPRYGIDATFLPGHFRAFTIKLCPLDGVYYCDIRPNMQTDPFLNLRIRTIDRFLCDDLWDFLER